VTTSDAERVRVIGPGQTYAGKQGFTYGAGASAETVGAEHVCMNILPVPAGGRAKVHYHHGIETIAYLLDGECVVHYGDSWNTGLASAPGSKSTSLPTCHTRHQTKVPRPVHGLWFMPPVATRTASFSCPISMHC
jgi:uncharacterized RmlC-like cupin family protein